MKKDYGPKNTRYEGGSATGQQKRWKRDNADSLRSQLDIQNGINGHGGWKKKVSPDGSSQEAYIYANGYEHHVNKQKPIEEKPELIGQFIVEWTDGYQEIFAPYSSSEGERIWKVEEEGFLNKQFGVINWTGNPGKTITFSWDGDHLSKYYSVTVDTQIYHDGEFLCRAPFNNASYRWLGAFVTSRLDKVNLMGDPFEEWNGYYIVCPVIDYTTANVDIYLRHFKSYPDEEFLTEGEIYNFSTARDGWYYLSSFPLPVKLSTEYDTWFATAQDRWQASCNFSPDGSKFIVYLDIDNRPLCFHEFIIEKDRIVIGESFINDTLIFKEVTNSKLKYINESSGRSTYLDDSEYYYKQEIGGHKEQYLYTYPEVEEQTIIVDIGTYQETAETFPEDIAFKEFSIYSMVDYTLQSELTDVVVNWVFDVPTDLVERQTEIDVGHISAISYGMRSKDANLDTNIERVGVNRTYPPGAGYTNTSTEVHKEVYAEENIEYDIYQFWRGTQLESSNSRKSAIAKGTNYTATLFDRYTGIDQIKFDRNFSTGDPIFSKGTTLYREVTPSHAVSYNTGPTTQNYITEDISVGTGNDNQTLTFRYLDCVEFSNSFIGPCDLKSDFRIMIESPVILGTGFDYASINASPNAAAVFGIAGKSYLDSSTVGRSDLTFADKAFFYAYESELYDIKLYYEDRDTKTLQSFNNSYGYNPVLDCYKFEYTEVITKTPNKLGYSGTEYGTFEMDLYGVIDALGNYDADLFDITWYYSTIGTSEYNFHNTYIESGQVVSNSMGDVMSYVSSLEYYTYANNSSGPISVHFLNDYGEKEDFRYHRYPDGDFNADGRETVNRIGIL